MSQQQTVLRVQTNNTKTGGIPIFEFLDLYSSIPITINKSFAELGDIGKRNSDYSVGVLLPGTKKNNAFFESYFNVDTINLYFDPNKRVPCWVLIDDEPYFTGYLRLNKISVLNSKNEYDITLFSTPAELYGSIGNNLLKDLNFDDDDYKFNHTFSLENVTRGFNYQNMAVDGEKPYPYFYPVVHNGYLYTGDTVNFTGGTILSRTRLYTSTSNSAGTLAAYASQAAAWADGVQEYRLNSPGQGPYDNQLKPGLSIWSLLQLMFKTYGYSIESDFFNTPWMKYLYLYGYFSSDTTKFSWAVYEIQTLPLQGVEVFFVQIENDTFCVVSKLGTGIPCYCDSDINCTLLFDNGVNTFTQDVTIPYGTSGLTVNSGANLFISGSSPDVPNGSTLKYLPVAVGQFVNFVDGDYVDFSLVIDQNIKQIDILSSIAKKFNLVLIPDPNNGYNIRIEPYDFYIGTGQIHNWSDKISYDKGFTVEPALNYIESELKFTDQDDNDEGNKLFKESNNRIYGQNIYYGPTSFKSQQKTIDTIFGPELIRKWDSDGVDNIGLPLGINYVGSNNQVTDGTQVNVNWIYKGVKTKPKIFWWLGSFNPFLDSELEVYNATNYWTTYEAYISNTSGSTFTKFDRIPVISHTMPMGNPDSNKINNDSQCILFNSEFPSDEIGVQTFNTYTENDAFSTFYQGRVSNLYNPNTRVLSGYFNLNYSDIKNLEPKDLIKVNEQLFVVSKIDAFNLTNRELTRVELIQFNNSAKQYVDRYFEYYYCDNPSVKFKFKTDFTNPNLLESNFGWSVYYDHQIGNLSSTASGFTSSFRYVQGFSTTVYTPYYIYEVSADDYNSSSAISWDCDTLHNYIYNTESFGPFQYSMPTFWLNSGSTQTGTNLFGDCSDFASAVSTYGILTGSSTYFGSNLCPTPTPTPTQTTTPTPTPTPTVTPSFVPTITVQIDYSWYEASDLMNQTVDFYYQGTKYIGSVTYDTISGSTTIGPVTIVNSNTSDLTLQKRICTEIPNTILAVGGPNSWYLNNVYVNGGPLGANAPIAVCPNKTNMGPQGSPFQNITNGSAVKFVLSDTYYGQNRIVYDINDLNSYPGTGNTIYNLVDEPYDATLYNSPTYTSGITTPDYLTFNGTNQYGAIPLSGNSFGYDDLTMGAWVRMKNWDEYNFISVKGEYEGILLGAKFKRFALIINGDSGQGAVGTVDFNLNQWYYVVGTWQSASKTARIYVNGQLQRQLALVQSPFASAIGYTLGYSVLRNKYTNFDLSTYEYYQEVKSGTDILNNYNNTKSLYGY